jgi:hypothetical protein
MNWRWITVYNCEKCDKEIHGGNGVCSLCQSLMRALYRYEQWR